MTPERLESVAPDMPDEFRRWFLEPGHGAPSYENQDWHLVLANWRYVPLLAEYVEDPAHPLEKRYDAFLALMVLQGFQFDPDRGDARQREALDGHIRRIVLTHPDFARAAAGEWLGWVDSLAVFTILGEPIPANTPEWVRGELRRRTGASC